LAIKGAEALWQAQCVPVIMRHASTITGPLQMAPMWAQYIDYARDLQHNGANEYYGHPGPATLALWARDLADAIRLL